MDLDQELAVALAANDWGKIAQIAIERAAEQKIREREGTPPAPAPRKRATRARKSPPPEVQPAQPPAPPPVAEEVSVPWIAPSRARPLNQKVGPDGKLQVEAEWGQVRIDKSKIEFQTDSKDIQGLTREQKKAEREKKKARDVSFNRKPATKIDIDCDRCNRNFTVYPTQLTERITEDERVEVFYLCNKCVKGSQSR